CGSETPASWKAWPGSRWSPRTSIASVRPSRPRRRRSVSLSTSPATSEGPMKQGFRVLDSDLHTMEPDDLWPKYLDEPFKRYAPQFLRGTVNAPNQPVIKIGSVEIGEMSKRAHTAVVGRDLQERAFERHPHYKVAHS